MEDLSKFHFLQVKNLHILNDMKINLMSKFIRRIGLFTDGPSAPKIIKCKFIWCFICIDEKVGSVLNRPKKVEVLNCLQMGLVVSKL